MVFAILIVTQKMHFIRVKVGLPSSYHLFNKSEVVSTVIQYINVIVHNNLIPIRSTDVGH